MSEGRVSKRVVTMQSLTPTERGFSMAGDTPAEVEVTDDGVRIRAKGERAPWKFIPWSEVWINAAAEHHG